MSNIVVLRCPEVGFGGLVGRSKVMTGTFDALRRAAASDLPVLLVGETGTGKELAARGLHDHGFRPRGPFVAVNAAALPDGLFEAELFGSERGAFTGALARRDGAFHQAHQGTLFLDEIGELSLCQQAKLLRVLDSGEVRRLGGAETERIDVRIVAATNRDLRARVREGLFRSDLFYRLAVLVIRMPALRERREDIELLARRILGSPARELSREAALALQDHDWPGNVRELRNVLRRAAVMSGSIIRPADLELDLGPPSSSAAVPERERISDALSRSNGNCTRAARILGMPRSSLLYKLSKLGLS